MTALGPIGALAICDVQTVRVFSFDASGSVGFAGTVSSIRVRVPAPLEAVLAFVGNVRDVPLVIRRGLGVNVLTFAGLIARNLLRAPLRFAKRKGIVTRGSNR